MNEVQALNILEESCKQKNINIRYEKGDFDGGYCVLRDSKVIVINKKLPELKKVLLLNDAIINLGFDKKELPLDLQLYIESEKPKQK